MLGDDLKKEVYQREESDIRMVNEDDKLGKTYSSLDTLHPK